jgi:putative MATE family efflux protein
MKKLTLFSLTWPIFVEFLLLMTLGFVDTFMLSQYDDAAAGAVSAATQITGFLNLVLLIASGGAGVLIAQYIGAGKKIEIEKVVSVSILTNAILGVIVSISMIFFHDDLLGFMKVSSELMPYAKTYLKIVGSFMFIQALMNAMSVTIKSHGRTKEIMYISLAMNLLNIFGDAVFIYGLFGVPVLGVKGIAMATVASRSIAMVLMTIFLFKRIVPLSALKHLVDKPITILKQILRIGLPATAEVISFNLTGIVLVTLLFANIGPEAVIAQAYTTKIFLFYRD